MFYKNDYERISESLETSEEILYAIEKVADEKFKSDNTYKKISEEPSITEIGLKIRENDDSALVTVIEKTSPAVFEIPNEPEIFGRINGNGNVDLLHWESGEAVTRYAECWPLNSDLSGSYEHAEGIELSREAAESLEIPIEGVDC